MNSGENICFFKEQLQQQKIDLTCPLCAKKYSRHDNLIAHQRSVHETTIECTICHKHFATHQGLEKHAVLHSDDRPFTCEVCFKTFKRADSLRQHEQTHYEGNYQCEEESCRKIFSSPLALHRHKRAHTDSVYHPHEDEVKCPSHPIEASHQIININNKTKQHQCTHCLKTFTCRQFHYHWHLKHSKLVSVESDSPFTNNYRVGRTSTIRKYIHKHEHRRIGDRCQHCLKLFCSKQDLQRHQERKHNLNEATTTTSSS